MRFWNRRRRRWRSGQEQEDHARASRALSQCIYLVDHRMAGENILFSVLGSSGSLYDVTFWRASRWTCTCPDYERRRKPCKHVQFVWFRVLGISQADGEPFFDGVESVLERISLTHLLHQDEVHLHTPSAPALAAPAATSATKVARRPHVGETCGICYEKMTESCKVFFCEEKCGNAIHVLCYKACVQHTHKTMCPYCRANMNPPEWRDEPRRKRPRISY